MKLCKMHQRAMRWALDYTYNHAYHAAKAGEYRTQTERTKDMANIKKLKLAIFQQNRDAYGKCNCDPTVDVPFPKKL